MDNSLTVFYSTLRLKTYSPHFSKIFELGKVSGILNTLNFQNLKIFILKVSSTTESMFLTCYTKHAIWSNSKKVESPSKCVRHCYNFISEIKGFEKALFGTAAIVTSRKKP